MNDEELFEKIMNKELTICETCDTIFEYIPQKRFCDECNLKRLRKYNEEKREEKNAYAHKYREENREMLKAKQREYNENNREMLNAKQRARYHANKEK
jgi:uncharacterized membrane protein (DUF106 family)